METAIEKTNQLTGEIIPMLKLDSITPAAAALQAMATATIQARVLQALKCPRDPETFRQRLLKECQRKGFADAAIYSKPIGKGTIEGPSIRFAEAVLRLYGNLLVEALVVAEDEENRTYRVMATDLEVNSTDYQDAVIAKTVERKNAEGREVLRLRRNSKGDPTYVVRATEDEMLIKVNAAISKLRRNKILALAPSDIVEEALAACEKTLRDAAAKDPDGEKRSLLDSFATFSVTPSDLAQLLGHAVDKVQPAELKQLRAIYQGIKQGETTWNQVIAAKAEAAKIDAKPTESKTAKVENELREPGLD